MKKNTIKALSLGVSSAIGASVVSFAYAAAPTAFEAWTVDQSGATANIIFNATCPVGFTCSVVATDDGFVQRTLDDGNQTVVQTIVAPRKAQLDAALTLNPNITFNDLQFADESFVRMSSIGSGGASNGGLASRSRTGNRVIDGNGSSTFDFTQDATILSGSFWSNTDAAAGRSNFSVNQVVSSADALNAGTNSSDFFSAFQFSEIKTAMGAASTEIGSKLNIAQVSHQVPANPLTANQKQAFVFSRVNSPIPPAGAGILASQTLFAGAATAVTGAATAQVEAIWIGQNFGAAGFGVEQVRDTTGGAFNQIHSKKSWATVGFSGTVANGGFDWNTTLGAGVYAPKF